MSWKAVPMEPSEREAVASLVTTVFGRGPRPSEDVQRELDLLLEPDRMFVAHDGPRVVGIGGAYTFDLALPGGAALPMSSISDVGVAPTHRRRGIMRSVMTAVLDQAVEREEPVAGLTASETTIYRRFGFGVATHFQQLNVDIRRLRLAEATSRRSRWPAEESTDGSPRLHLAGEDEGNAVMPAVWARSYTRSPGELSRNANYWATLAVDPEEDRDGATARFVVVHTDEAGEPDGAASYRLDWKWASDGANTLVVEDLAAVSDEVETTLLRYLLDVDLVTRFQWFAAPVDHPLRWRLADARALDVTTERDHLWLRVLDVARCLSARRYAAAGGLVIEVVDDDRPALGGRFRLDAGPGGADCTATTADPDVTLGVADLGSLLLGGVRWSVLARAGLVDEHTPGALARADALFRPERTPYCGTHF
jgi:predicted acetyltransferase